MEHFSKIDFNKAVLFDTCILMVGIDKRMTNQNYSLENMQKLWLDCILGTFKHILLHKIVYNELDSETKALIDSYLSKNISIVDDTDLIGKDPEYTRILEKIEKHDLIEWKGYTNYFLLKFRFTNFIYFFIPVL